MLESEKSREKGILDFCELASARYSCRALDGQPLEQAAIDRILTAAQTAPTAVNRQPFHLWAVQSKEAVEKLCSTTPFDFGASFFLVVGAKDDEAWVRPSDGRNFGDVDASIVATQIMLAVHDLGLGTTWVGHFDAPKLKELFPAMRDYDLIAIFPIGRPLPQAKPSSQHFKRKPVAELVSVV